MIAVAGGVASGVGRSGTLKSPLFSFTASPTCTTTRRCGFSANGPQADRASPVSAGFFSFVWSISNTPVSSGPSAALPRRK